ncbi:PAQR family membrane homeostasis protein TrhA [Brevundimonas aurifodinae]|uniref:Hemolysin III family protein n=2 Tax=Brevundimonas TaxID=41275 RepID=A0ABV1NJ25_9CAUL|nr:MAG: hemolysin III [Brevundimonas sp. 12-68-7]OYX34917.1 MAG: hemolysin III [Brevundimonas subvibrioides]
MLDFFKRHARRLCTPDQIDLEEHYESRSEHTADLVVHTVGLTLAAVGGVVLAVLSAIYGGGGVVFATAIYALCLVAMLTASTVYNLTRPCAARPVLRRLDEAAIFLMIAGSYTPFTTQRFEGWWAIGFTLVVWTIAIAGVAAKMVAPRISDAFWSGVYVVFGWIAVIALKPMIDTVHPIALGLLVLGGLIYTAGVFFFIAPKLKYRRAIWHGFVVAGAGVHWAAVLVGVVLAPNLA